MISSILGKKIGMTQIFDKAGRIVPVTVIEAGPCQVVQVKTVESDGYAALQVAFGDNNEKHTSKPLMGVFKKASLSPKKIIREIPADAEEHKPGDVLTCEIMKDVTHVDVIGTSKGKGFAGVVKRHHFHGQPASHGAMGSRVPGSIGSSAYPSRVLKGVRMAGHMGNRRVMQRGLELVKVYPARNLLLVKGAIPGHNGAYVIVRQCADWMLSRKKKVHTV